MAHVSFERPFHEFLDELPDFGGRNEHGVVPRVEGSDGFADASAEILLDCHSLLS